MTVVRWEAPPADHGHRRNAKSKYEALAETLRAKPGKWAVVKEGITTGTAGSFASRIRRGAGAFGPAGSFESKVTGPAGGMGIVYARFVGLPSTVEGHKIGKRR